MNFLKEITGFSILSLAVGVNAQNTTVSALVTDTDGTQWTNGSWSLSFAPNPSNPNLSQYRIGGASLNPAVLTQVGVISNSATFSIVMYDNTAITPVGSGWILTVCPQATSACGVYNFSTAGATLDISSALTNVIPAPRFKAVAGTYGYIDLEAQPQNIPGANYYNVQSGCQKYYNTLTLVWTCFSTGATFLPLAGGTLTGPVNSVTTNNYTSSTLTSPAKFIGDGLDPNATFLFTNGATNFNSEIFGGLSVPPSSTQVQSSGVAGMVVNNSPTTNAVGGYFSALCNLGFCWSINPIVSDIATGPGSREQAEFDFNVHNVNTLVQGVNVSGFWTVQPTAGDAFGVFPPNGFKWPTGLHFQTGATTNAIILEPQGSAPSQLSQQIIFRSFNSIGTEEGLAMLMDTNGNLDYSVPGGLAQISQNGSWFTNITGTTNSSFGAVNAFQPSLANGNYIAASFGTLSASNNNSAEFGFQNVGGTGSTSNLATMGVYGGVNLTVDHLGNTNIPGNLNVTGSVTCGSGCGGGGGGAVANISLTIPTITVPSNLCYGSTGGTTTPQTFTMTGLAPGMGVAARDSANPASVTGYGAVGGLAVRSWVSGTNQGSYVICNTTGASITGSSYPVIMVAQ